MLNCGRAVSCADETEARPRRAAFRRSDLSPASIPDGFYPVSGTVRVSPIEDVPGK
jgi:hypothetical protein